MGDAKICEGFLKEEGPTSILLKKPQENQFKFGVELRKMESELKF